MDTSRKPSVGQIVAVHREDVERPYPFARVHVNVGGVDAEVMLTAETSDGGYLAEVVACW